LSGPRSSADALRAIDDTDTSDLRNRCVPRNQRYHNHVFRQHDDLSVGPFNVPWPRFENQRMLALPSAVRSAPAGFTAQNADANQFEWFERFKSFDS
jgi:hypothetical protein